MKTLLFASAIALSFCPSAFGQISISKDRTESIYITGVPANSVLDVSFNYVQATTTAVSDGCGTTVFRNKASAPFKLSSSIYLSTKQSNIYIGNAPIGVIPRCTNGQYSDFVDGRVTYVSEGGVNYFRTANNDLVLIYGLQNREDTIEYETTRTRKVTANSCGLAKVVKSGTFNISSRTSEDTVTINGTEYNVRQIPEQSAQPICYRNNLYAPSL
jgi:hypothetical protein